MTETLQTLVFLLTVVAVVVFAAARLNFAPPVLLVAAGVVLALLPGVPPLQLEPEIVLLFVLPPVIYVSAIAMSWREFQFNLRPILLLAIGCVVFTTISVAAAMHFLLGWPWAAGFVLGAVVSPPDAVAPLAIARRMQLPRRILVILEGEGLANDATALVLYRFAVAAVSVGAFSLAQASETFVAIVVGELCWGVGVGWMMLRLRRFMDDPRIEMVLSLVTPFLAYWPPEHLGGSGVIATVATGLYISWNGPRLISAETRIQGVFFWEFVTYLIEGLVFIFTGLQAQALAATLRNGVLTQFWASAALVVAVVIVARFVWIYPMTYLPRWLSASLAKRDPSPPWTYPFVIAFTGVRGIVSLAAALAIPMTTASGAAFPYREQIFFLAFVVVMATFVFQGAMLPWVIRKLGLARLGREERRADRAEEFYARQNAIEASSARLDALAQERDIPREALLSLRSQLDYFATRIRMKCDADEDRRALIELHDDLDLTLIEVERDFVNGLLRSGELKDEARRRIERELDLREADVLNRRNERMG
ncbi:Na+/H+ antiporter [Methylocystis parvus]|uniref:Na+/H+ antiporter n=1 Tax=Methylocystis parvus TaxID=134 RepID=A0A6B8M085_9HYPH|nr:Na+/H+ antiporter [Methylocystis parvus]QGM96231.1 Na+/H+ antiporter [Methylocystis parvus]WBJ99938.1 Na+/H+ antiporter [Methylocystis parvus OBBP]